MTDSPDGPRPQFKGLSWQRSDNFSFYRPLDWQRFEWQDARQGVLFGPDPDDDATLFAVAVRDLGLRISAEDIDDLEAGFLEGIHRLPDHDVESHERWAAGRLFGLEAKYTFSEAGNTRKRWVRVLHQDTRQITVTAQGATVEQFDYWLPMFYEQMMTFQVHPRAVLSKQ